jgi:hypothetical protein
MILTCSSVWKLLKLLLDSKTGFVTVLDCGMVVLR